MNPCWSLLLSLLPLMAGCWADPSGREGGSAGNSKAVQERAAPDFELRSIDGKAFRLASLKGNVVLMDFWATWCEPCRDSAPLFQRLFESYRKEGFHVVGVNVDAEADEIPGFLAEHRVSYSVILDPDNAVSRLYRVRGIPNLFLIDKQGRVRKHWVGWDDSLKQVLESEIQTLLREKA